MDPLTYSSRAGGRKSSFSTANGNCVVIEIHDDEVLVYDDKNPADPPQVYTPDEWVAFILGVKNGEFDPPQAWVDAFIARRTEPQPAR